MLTDTGSLQIEQKYVGKNVLGKDIEIQRDESGGSIGILFIAFAIIFNFYLNLVSIL